MPELTIPPHLPHVHSRVDSNTFTMGKPMPESTPQSGTLDLVSVRQPNAGVNYIPHESGPMNLATGSDHILFTSVRHLFNVVDGKQKLRTTGITGLRLYLHIIKLYVVVMKKYKKIFTA
jgi:hypothetical protein